ncbi:hypothetical protein M9Y10_039957 [Tritrichomonas musculus]|uniref:DUF3447 domain-containing protein n=1 Tax=Tritrichomonas musculus TaxID=1915356 RepID=A0ABR2GQC6_9EUKA
MVDLSLQFSTEALQEARLVAELENQLMNLNDKNFTSVFNFLKNSIFIQNENRIKQLANHIIFAVSKRYMSIPLYSKLTCDLYDTRLQYIVNEKKIINDNHISEDNNQNEDNQISSLSIEECKTFRKALDSLHTVFFPIIIPCNVDSRTLYFLYFCVVGSLFSAVDIVNILNDSLELEPDHISELLTLFCFFAPEVEELDRKLFQVFINAVINEANNIYCQPYVRQFHNEMDDLMRDNWSLLKSRREAMKSGDMIIDSLFSDSIDDFQTVVSMSPNFDLNQNINESIFSPPHMFSKTLMQFAARCGSVKCFKYILLNNSNITEPDLREAVGSAIIGGNNEIVRLLKQRGIDFKGSLGSAAKAHRNAMFHWLEATEYPVCKGPSTIGNDIEAVFGAVEACNMRLLLELLEKGIDINLKSHTNESILSASIAAPIDAFSLLISHKAFQSEKQDFLMRNSSSNNEYSPLSIAVDRRVFDVVDYFFKKSVREHFFPARSAGSIPNKMATNVTATITRQQQQLRQQHLVEDCNADGFVVFQSSSMHSGNNNNNNNMNHTENLTNGISSGSCGNLVLVRPFNLDNLIHQAAFQGDKQIMETILKFPGVDVNSVNRVLFFLYL